LLKEKGGRGCRHGNLWAPPLSMYRIVEVGNVRKELHTRQPLGAAHINVLGAGVGNVRKGLHTW
jgi:hypothetical protein